MKKLNVVIIIVLCIALGIMTYLYLDTKKAAQENLEEILNQAEELQRAYKKIDELEDEIELKNAREESKNNVVGVYYTENWNNSGATLILNEDGTCRYPSSSKDDCTWVKNGNIITITNDGRIHEATIVNNGVILHDHFFEKKN